MVSKYKNRDLNTAAENFFNNPPPEPKPAYVPSTQLPKGGSKASSELKSIFKVYAGSNSFIDYEGIEKFCDDLGIDPTDPVILYLSY